MVIDNVKISASGFNPSPDELVDYFFYVKARVPDVDTIRVTLADDGSVNIEWTKRNQPFERIRRITGYLTGDLNSWNNAKQAEERDRVKHS